MNKLIVIFLMFSLIACGSKTIKKTESDLGLIPKPVETIVHDGEFTINKETVVVATENAKGEAEKFVNMLSQSMGFKLKLSDKEVFKNGIFISISDTLKSVGKEGYKLDVSEKGITLMALKPAGLFYGIQTIRQLLPNKIYSESPIKDVNWSIPCVSIVDSPRFGWRGYMLDVSRNFFDVAHIKRLIDRMAIHKLNLFHWHLTDDEGWRIEIKGYPKLTEVGAWRGKDEKLKPSRGSGNERYGGYYTQEEIQEIVAYAAERYVQVMPEIDVPGHARAMVVAYPELLPDGISNSKSVQGISDNVISPVKKETYKILNEIIKEITTLFPFEYIHIGGDEVNTTAWLQSPSCVQFMKKNNLKTGHELQNFFIKEMETIISNHGKKMIGWNEILEGGNLSNKTAVMSWIGTEPGFESAKNGHPVIMTPGQHTYFDMKSSKDDKYGHWWAGLVPIKRVYNYDPFSKNNLTKKELENIFGIQACLWSEYLHEKGRAQYQTWPRLCALAEVAWTPQKDREFTDFYNRIGRVHLQRLDELNVGYRVPQPKAILKKDSILINVPWIGAEVRYTTDASEPTKNSALYEGRAIYIENSQNFRMKLFTNNGRESRTVKEIEIFREIAAEWKDSDCSTTYKTVKFDIKGIDASSFWYLDFMYKKGGHRLDIRSVKLMENGVVISSDIHNGYAGSKHTNNRYRVFVKSFNETSKYSIDVEMRSDGGTNSNGIISLERSEFKEPVVKVKTKMEAVNNFGFEKAIDWNRKTYFKSLEKGKKGNEFTFYFSEVFDIKNLEVLSGHPSKNEDIIVDGSVFISDNGKEFTKINDFNYGTSKTNFEDSKLIKAVKIVLNATHESQIIIQDLQIK